jgi:hypothetical protein
MSFMAHKTKNRPMVRRDSLVKKPLVLLNFPNKQKMAAYEYLLNSSELPAYYPAFDEETEEILSTNKKSALNLLAESKELPNKRAAKKLQEIALLKAYKQMYDTGATKPFKQAVKVMYGSPDKDLFWSVLEETLDHAYHNAKSPDLLKEVQRLISLRKTLSRPNTQFISTRSNIFKKSKTIFKLSFSEELAVLRKEVAPKPWVHRYSQKELIDLFNALVKYYKLDEQGWVVEGGSKAEKAMVNYDIKTISVADGSFRLSRPRAIGWALHEVGVHAFARPHISQHARTLGDRRIIEEGLGVFIEQMVFTRFQPVRHLRYIALGLALGLDGNPRNAKEVYEIIWRLRYLGGVAKSKKFAKEYAAKEVVRVFRGMPLDQKGLVITKDRAYIEGSQLIWAFIEKNGPEFIFEKLLGKNV